MNRTRNSFNRRSFLQQAALASTSFSILGPAALGLRGQTPANSRLNIAGIGVGGQGGGNLNQMASENIVALCDVDSQRAAGTFQKFPKAKRYQDFRRMLDEMDKEIDAVMIATPDHTHAVAAIHAIKRGKHVFCEKPLAHSVWEVREIVRAAREHKVITQLGNQGHAADSMRVFREWVEDGVIGNVREVHAICRSVYSQIDKIDEVLRGEPIPQDLNWDLWLGPAKMRPYHSAYVPGKWRSWSDFGTGVIGDWTCHILDPVFWTLNLGAPSSVQAETGDWDPKAHGETFPRGTVVRFEFPGRENRPPVKITWYDGPNRPERPSEMKAGEELPEIGALVVGDKGKIIYGSHGASRPRVLSEEIMAGLHQQPKRLARSPGHYKEWIESCKSGKPAGSNFDYGGPLTEIALVGLIAMRFKGQKLHWDSAAMRFTNESEANKYLRSSYRDGWAL